MKLLMSSFYLFKYLLVLSIIAGLSESKINYGKFDGSKFVNTSQFIKIPKTANKFHTLNLIYSKNQLHCASANNGIIKPPLIPRRVVEFSSNPVPKVQVDFPTTETVLLIDSLASFQDTFLRFIVTEYFQNTGKYKLLFCKEMATDVELFKALANLVWRYKMINFVFVYFDPTIDVVNEAQYNPFTDELRIVSIDDVDDYYDEYPDKLKNMNGYPLKVIDSRHYLKTGLCSFSCHFEQSLKISMNASLVYHYLDVDDSHTYNIFQRISFSDIDVCIQPQAVSRRNIPEFFSNKIDFTYPHMIDNIIVLVPKPTKLKEWTSIFFCFNTAIMGVVSLLCALMPYLNKALSLNRPFQKLDVKFFVLSLFRVPVSGLSDNKTVIKATWLLFSLFLCMLFENSFLKNLLTDKLNPEINTIEDLKNSGIQVYACRFQNVDPRKVNLSFSFTVIPRTKWEKLILKNDGKYAFLGTYTDISFMMNYFERLHIDFKYQYLYETILPKHASLIVKKKSPYVHRLGTLAAKIIEFGITRKTPNTFKSITVSDVRMTFNHFLGVFLVLGCGLLIASVVFVFEVFSPHLCALYYRQARRSFV